MPFIKMKDGSVAHIKFAKRRRPKCEFCRRMAATLECDYELSKNLLGEPILCNAKMCWVCSRQVGEDKDYCPRHS